MQTIPKTMITEDTTMDIMTLDTEDTMISPTGLITIMATEAETTTIINRRILPGKKAMKTNGGTILVTTPALMTITNDVETCMQMTSIDAASTVNSQPTVCTALKATTADEAASAQGHNRARYTEASLT